jgi:23S rRNA (uridine2552-2'-O)-methyltransferase
VSQYDRKDHLHQLAKREGYRSRAAYKLLEIHERTRLLRPGQRVVDLGCWPGGWLQVASEIVGPNGRVVGVDLARIEPPLGLANVFAFEADLSDPETLQRIRSELGGPADVLLCDAAPKLTGIRATDRAREEALLEAVEWASPRLLRESGTLLLKLLECPEAKAITTRLAKAFESARILAPRSTRKGSSERYWLGQNLKAAAAAG